MRILHTSDWHLGQHFIGRSRAAEHQAFLLWLVSQVKALNIDAIIVAGDIFDTATPPSYARELYNQFIVELPVPAGYTGWESRCTGSIKRKQSVTAALKYPGRRKHQR